MMIYTQSISSCDKAQAKMSRSAYEVVCEQRIEPVTQNGRKAVFDVLKVRPEGERHGWRESPSQLERRRI